MKHLTLSLTDLVPECQAGVYCPECTEPCPISVTTVIHHCLNCAETYCLLCAHEFGCCLTCEADAEAWASVPPMLPMPCIPDVAYAVSSEHPSDSLLQKPAETSAQMPVGTFTDMLAEMPAKLPPQFKIPSIIPKGKHVRSRHTAKDETSSEDEQDRAAVPSHSAAKDDSLSEGNLMVIYQLHHRIRVLEGEQKRLECALDPKDIMIRNLWDEMKQKDKK